VTTGGTVSRPTVLADVVRIDRTRIESPAHQIYACVARGIQDGLLPPGTRLPTVRALAQEAGVAVNTVAKAFRRLSEAGLVITRGRAGTVIAPRDTATDRVERAAHRYVTEALELGVGPDTALAAVRAAYAELDPPGS
jgi:DNA-binding transcriptional regulator YhcF (GntR family)